MDTVDPRKDAKREAWLRWIAKNPDYKRNYYHATKERDRARKAESDRRYREKNAEVLRAKKLAYREKNRERFAAYSRDWYRQNIDRARESRAQEYWADPEAARLAARRWARENPEYVAERAAQYRRANPEGARERRRRYRARKRGVAFEPWTTVEILERDGWLCMIEDCGCPDGRGIDPGAAPNSLWQGVADHIVPVAKDGDDIQANLQAAHRSCNCAKGDRYN